MQHRLDRALRERPIAELLHVIEEVALPVRQSQAHPTRPLSENLICVILPHLAHDREHLRSQKTPAT